MMNRIEERLAGLKQSGQKAFITYLTAGLPTLEKTAELLFAQAEAGIDVIELGIPFSDPIADGPVIQNASYEAIQNGATLTGIFEMMQRVRALGCNVPVVFMMYYNTAYHYGLEKFIGQCADCGVDGLIIPDLPYEEQGEIRAVSAKNPAAPLLIQLVSPVSKQRIPMLLENARGFVYCVSQMGVTGTGTDFHKNVRTYLSDVHQATDLPVMMGFGIRTAEDVAPVRELIDGAIVGSHFIRLLQAHDFSADAARNYIREFKAALNA